MNDIVVIDGEVSLLAVLDAELNLEQPESGEFGEFTAMRDLIYPAYEGPTQITPSSEEQILPTAMKTTMENIVISPIPNNYGLITWDGSTLMVS